MNIELFNKQLSIKVAKATNLEKRGDYENAINAWLTVSDMSITFSKTQGIDSTFRNMLIKRTEQIIEHIKKLKLKIAKPEIIHDEDKISRKEFDNQDSSNNVQDEIDESKSRGIEINQNNDFKEKPDGILEIKASKDFKIITPHEELDLSIFKDNEPIILTDENSSKNDDKMQEKQGSDKKLICFACGYDKNPPNAKRCKNCNVELN